MLDRILKHKTKNITRAAIVLSFSAFLSHTLALVRDRLLAGTFGAGEVLDLYFAAFRLPDLIQAVFVSGGLAAVFLPVFSKEYEKDKEEAFLFANNLLNFTFLFLAVLSVIFFVTASQLVKLIAPGFTSSQLQTLAWLMRIMLLSPILFGLSSIFSGLLQYFDRFIAYGLAPVFYNLGIIFGIIFLAPRWGVYGLVVGPIIGALAHFLVQVPSAVQEGFFYRPVVTLRNHRLKETISLIPFTAVGAFFVQLNVIVITALASTLFVGSISIFTLTKNLRGVPVSLIALPFCLASFPVLSKKWTHLDKKDFWEEFSRIFRQMLFLVMPISVFTFILRAQVVRLVFQTGRWGWTETQLSAASLGIFSFSIFSVCFVALFRRVFYTIQKAKTISFSDGLNLILTVAFSFLFLRLLQTGGIFSQAVMEFLKLDYEQGVVILALPLALTLGSFAQFLFLLFYLKNKTGMGRNRKILSSLLRVGVLSLASGGVVWLALRPLAAFLTIDSFFSLLLQTGVAGASGALFYFLVSFSLSAPEMEMLFNEIRGS